MSSMLEKSPLQPNSKTCRHLFRTYPILLHKMNKTEINQKKS